jgi:hypothetical protein
MITGLFWWHPIVWIAAWRIREAEDLCCDAIVIKMMPGGHSGYARTLLDVVDFVAETKSPEPALGFGIGNANSLKRRLTMIMKGTSKARISWVGRLAIAALSLAILPLAVSQSQERTKTDESTQKKSERLKLEIREEILEIIRDIDIDEIVRDALEAARVAAEIDISSTVRDALDAIDIDSIRGAIEISDDVIKDVHVDMEALEEALESIDIELEGIDVALKQIEIDIEKIVEDALEDVKAIKKKTKTDPKVPPHRR